MHNDDKKEASRRICRAAFAHSKGNVIGPAMASFLTRHSSRFYFSHHFQYCPVRDLGKALNNEKVSSTVVYGGGKSDHYLENYALHYLNRPLALENLSPRKFFEEYNVTVIRNDPKDGEPDLRFISDTGFFKHPSAKKTRKSGTEQCRQGVQRRANGRLDIKVSQWSFPDTAQFKNDILTCPASAIHQSMEEYAYTMLLLHHHYRSHEDLLPSVTAGSFPYVMKLREIYKH